MLNYEAGPVGKSFMDSKKYIKLISGPVGGGKSTVALFDLLARAIGQEPFKNVRRTKFIILRNTMQQLKQTVKPLIDQWFITLTDGTMGKWRLTDNVFEIKVVLADKTVVHSELLLQAADTPDDIRRLLSLEASAAWVEEAREIDPEVFDSLQGRVNRFPNRASGGVTYAGVICSTNPPPLGGFWHKLITEPPKNVAIFTQPAALLDDGTINPDAENLRNLAPDYYDNLILGKTEEWMNVYLRNQFGAGDMGQPVYRSSFKPGFHVSKSNLQAISQSINPLIIGMDNGLQAAAVIGQQDMRGRVNVLGECFVPADTTMGVESFLDKLLIPKLRSEYPLFKPENICFVLDPACWQRSQVDEKTIADAIHRRGYRVIKPNTNDPERRIAAVEGLLVRQIDGVAGFLIDPRCAYLASACEWGYRFKKTAAGLGSSVPEKNHFSHISDAMQYLCWHFNMQLDTNYNARSKARTVAKSRYTYN